MADHRSEDFNRAMSCISAALEGRTDTKTARVAFRGAARAAGVLVDHLDLNPLPSPVTIRFGKIGLIRSAATVEEALKLLRDPRWPSKDPVNLRARAACMKASNGLDSCQDARAAFVEAAREAGVLLDHG